MNEPHREVKGSAGESEFECENGNENWRRG